jgi:serine/threonine-protein kinase
LDATQALKSELEPGFEIIRRLGGGPLSSVYLAREPALRRLVAVKALHPQATRRPKALARFRREARSLARVSHPNVVSIFQVGDLASAVPFLSMQYVRGRDLSERLQSDGVFDVAEACRLLAAIATGLEAVHAHGIVHRDVRPSSVLIEDSTGRVLLSDFGLVAFLASMEAPKDKITTAGHVVTDIRYTSPELLKGEQSTGATDVYSLGVLAYDVLAGDGPFQSSAPHAMARAHLAEAPVSFASRGIDLPAALEALISACLAKEPEDRPTASDLARSLLEVSGPAGHPASLPTGRQAVGPREVLRPSGATVEPGGHAAEFSMQMLGGLDLRAPSGSLTSVLRQPKRVALLAFLAAGPESGYQRRDTLIGIFWPDADPDSGRHALRQALYVLRRELGADVLRTRGDEEVGLDAASFHSDAARFDALARSGKAEEAMALYTGDLLPGFYLDDTPEFERWLEVARVRFRRKAAELAWSLAESAETDGRKGQAARWARAAVEHDPFDEAALHRLIGLLAEQGDRAGALSAYAHFARRLADEYAAEPSAETRELVERVRAGR